MQFKDVLVISLAMCLIITTSIIFFTPSLIAEKPRAPKTHNLIIENTAVTAFLFSYGTEEIRTGLTPRLLSPKEQRVVALDIHDVSRRVKWLDHTFPLSVWSWEFQEQPLVYQKVWGPNNGTYFVEFSKATMSKVTVNCFGHEHVFEFTFPETYGEGFWFLWLEEGVDI